MKMKVYRGGDSFRGTVKHAKENESRIESQLKPNSSCYFLLSYFASFTLHFFKHFSQFYFKYYRKFDKNHENS